MDWAFDVETGRFLKKNGMMYRVSGREELKQNIWKVLKTQKGRYSAYPAEYGCGFKPGSANTALACERLKAEINSALMKLKGVLGTEDFSFSRDDDRICAKFTVNTVYGRTEAEY